MNLLEFTQRQLRDLSIIAFDGKIADLELEVESRIYNGNKRRLINSLKRINDFIKLLDFNTSELGTGFEKTYLNCYKILISKIFNKFILENNMNELDKNDIELEEYLILRSIKNKLILPVLIKANSVECIKEKTGHQYYGTEMSIYEAADNCGTCDGVNCDFCKTMMRVSIDNINKDGDPYMDSAKLAINHPFIIFTLSWMYIDNPRSALYMLTKGEKKQFFAHLKELEDKCREIELAVELDS